MTEETTQEIKRIDKGTIAERLWNEIKDEHGELHPEAMSDDWIESLRSRIQTGELPAFMPTDYREGYYRNARAEIMHFFIKHRRRRNGWSVRAFIPIILLTGQRAWVSTDDYEESSVQHALKRLNRSIDTGLMLHGGALVATNTYDLEALREYGHRAVDVTIDRMAAMREYMARVS